MASSGSSKVSSQERNVFVTVGTTRFDKLVAAATSPLALDWMVSQGYTSLTIQYGTGMKPEVDASSSSVLGLKVRTYSFQPSLDDDMKSAALILSHAGAGTVMEALRLRKKLVVVINTALMDNHQTELAGAMAERGHLLMVEYPELLNDKTTWSSFEGFDPIPHQGGDPQDFARLLDAFLGFSSNTKID